MPPGAEDGNDPPQINLYEEQLESGKYKVFVQKKNEDNNVRTSISVLKIAELIYEITNGKSINDIKKVGRNRVIVECSNASTANNLVKSAELKNKNLNVYIPNFLTSRAAIVRNIDSDFSVEKLMSIIDSRQFKIKNILRMNRRSLNEGKVEYIPTNTIKVFFHGQNLPEYIYIWNARFACEPFIPYTKQCYKCFRFGHVSKQCKSGTEKCFTCGNAGHTKNACPEKAPKCCNCGKEHESTNRNCPERIRQNNINTLMATHNMSYQEASLEIPKVKETANYYSVRTENKFSILNQYDTDFPEINQYNDPQNQIPTYVPPPISRTKNLKNRTAIVRNTQKRSRQERSSSEEREEQRRLNINKKSKEDGELVVTVATIHSNGVQEKPEDNANMEIQIQESIKEINNQNTQEVCGKEGNNLDIDTDAIQIAPDTESEEEKEISKRKGRPTRKRSSRR